jgi:DeoR/GlpR family transcriptional regulator of sugar metabolism
VLASQRRSRIAEELSRVGAVRVADLAESLGVSEMTVRRDLEIMQDGGLLTKVHGGAVQAGRSAEEPGFDAKLAQATAEKAAIARVAAALVPPGSSVALSAGTTTWTLARLLPAVPGITVVTNSLGVANEIYRTDSATPVILTGGVRTPSDALVGPVADATIRSLYVDILFLGVHGMDPEAGFTTPNLAEAETNRSLVTSARRIIVLADHHKWRVVGMSRIAPFSSADVVVTDDGMEAEGRRSLADGVGDLIIAPMTPAQVVAR